ncbi:hypothetical protein JKP88DRAFT_251010 [Tribonema minus]|uniref:Uncharacterized protein n=1 Tax=Tribonema minus TaxID=303371 RepID=A0A835ZFP0_9STRA|nr:hypothetical protein JKP88DRAFT_251010 [Tribonema minus]
MTATKSTKRTKEDRNKMVREMKAKRRVEGPQAHDFEGRWMWLKQHYTRQPLLLDEAAQRMYYEKQIANNWGDEKWRPSYVRFLHLDGTHTASIISLSQGLVRLTPRTAEENAERIRKQRAFKAERNLGQLHHMEAAASQAFISILREHGFSLEFKTVSDNCIVDAVIIGTNGKCVPIQFKSAEFLEGCPMQFNVQRADGLQGRKYFGMYVIGLGVINPHQPFTYDNIDDVAPSTLAEIFFTGDCSTMHNKHMNAQAGSTRNSSVLVSDVDKLRLAIMDFSENIEKRLQHIDAFTLQECLYGKANFAMSSTAAKELKNIETIALLVVDTDMEVTFPVRQNETTDFVLVCGNQQITFSMKTAFPREPSHLFPLSEAINWRFCDFVIAAFWDSGASAPSSFVIIGAATVYDRTRRSYTISNTTPRLAGQALTRALRALFNN